MGEEVFFLVVVWLAGWDVFVEGRNAQDGENGRFDLPAGDCKGCGARGIAKHGLWGRV